MSMLTILVLILFIFSVIIHEISHGIVAYWLGDDTAYLSGRITLDPVKHIDPIMTIIVPLLMYYSTGMALGGAKPVPVNPYRLRRPKKDIMWVTIAGPASNFLLAIIFALGFRFSYYLTPQTVPGTLEYIMQQGLGTIVFYNLFLAFFNLIPIPPLDGGHIAIGLLPHELAVKYQKIQRYGMFILVTLLFMGFLNYVALPSFILGQLLTGQSFRYFELFSKLS